MKISAITRAMAQGLRRPACIIDMGSYGESRGPEDEHGHHYPERLCFGCAATNALANLAGITQYTPDQVDDRETIINLLPPELREVFTRDEAELALFESAVDDLRRGNREDDETFLRMGLEDLARMFPDSDIDTVTVRRVFNEHPLPKLLNDYREPQLAAYEDFAERLEAVGE